MRIDRRIEERFLDGSVHVHVGVALRNPTQTAVKFVGERDGIVREICQPVGKRPDGTTIYASRHYDVVIEPGQTVVVPPAVANVLLRFYCFTCHKPFVFGQPGEARGKAPCVDPTHNHRRVDGGLAPSLLVVDDQDRVIPVEVNPDLVERPRIALDSTSLHERVMRRLGGGQ